MKLKPINLRNDLVAGGVNIFGVRLATVQINPDHVVSRFEVRNVLSNGHHDAERFNANVKGRLPAIGRPAARADYYVTCIDADIGDLDEQFVRTR